MKLWGNNARWVILLACLACSVLSAYAANWKTFDAATWSEDASNDGDSFTVVLDGAEQRIRLYFVDCPESVADTMLLIRIREQMRYFGLSELKKVIHWGKTAANFTREQLCSSPFTLHTSFANALGRSKDGRIYSWIEVKGVPLAEMLVRNGLARNRGVGKALPNGTSRAEVQARLSDCEAAAMLERKGIWEASDGSSLIKEREMERKDGSDISKLQEQLEAETSGSLDVGMKSNNEMKKRKK